MKLLKQTLVFLKANKYTVINVIIMLSNPWWWVIIQRDIWIGLLIFALSITVLIYFFYNRSKIFFLCLLLLTMIIIIISLRQALDESILRSSALDIQSFYKRHEFYANNLGKLYTNRISLAYFREFHLPLFKLQGNFFGNLDLNLYFFGSHPRERTGVEEFEKYMPIFLPFFLIGFLYSIYRPNFKLIIYSIIILLISSIISPKYKLGPILLFPVVNYMITVGLVLSLKVAQGVFKK